MRYDVALAACKSYEDAEVSAALETAVTAAGGLDWVTPGMRVALKLNLVSAMKPEEAATVHPAVVCALVRMLQARGAHVVLGDSPGGLYNAAHLQRVYDVTGLRAAEALIADGASAENAAARCGFFSRSNFFDQRRRYGEECGKG